VDNFTYNNIKIEVSPDNITFRIYNSSITFMPGEGEKIRHLISLADRMSGFRALPPFIEDKPFKIAFDETGGLELTKGDADVGLLFRFETADDVIVAVNKAIEKVRDERSLRPGPRGSHAFAPTPDPIIEGR